MNKPEVRSGGQSGDLQGLSNVESADSESVDELLEEGNAFEADAVKGVEEAGDFDEREVHTHEVPEDDVPGEYLDAEYGKGGLVFPGSGSPAGIKLVDLDGSLGELCGDL
jgi:hypothetical protein